MLVFLSHPGSYDVLCHALCRSPVKNILFGKMASRQNATAQKFGAKIMEEQQHFPPIDLK
jgi:hypothetical protein